MTAQATVIHQPVLLQAVLDGLNVRADGCYVDCTFGRGGHTAAILERLNAKGRMIAFDRDAAAIHSRPDLAGDPRLELIQQRFSLAGKTLAERELVGRVDGILMDLGVSSPQLDDPQRGFSFRQDGPLDMRMDPSTGDSAGVWLNRASEREIRECLWEYGEERMARKIAAKICAARGEHAIRTTRDLAHLVSSVVRHEHRIDPATRTFQALRIVINDELNELRLALTQLVKFLRIAGRLLVLSFHSLEDRIVKRFFRDAARATAEPHTVEPVLAFRLLSRKPQLATAGEVTSNPRARSARLRGLERIT
ncbi:MAG: 16S rRNA (cytosine(1402)-N(4))-methyltransferase RsmH [Gammaproteobacteria bacterium]